jgi:cytochrome b involved in lipid metabolism
MKKALIIIAIIAVFGVVGFIAFSGGDDASNNQTTNQSQNTPKESTNDPEQPEGNSKTFTVEEVEKHNNKENCWTIINSKVYDLTSFISQHPGRDEILRACGKDGTSLFKTRTTDEGEKVGSGTPHSSSAESTLKGLQIGTLAQ